MNTQQIIETAEEKLIHTYNRYQIVLDKGDGVRLYDTDGKEYLEAAFTWRKEMAIQESLPEFLVFSNATLEAFTECIYEAKTEDDFLLIPGVDVEKFNKYFDDLSTILAQVEPKQERLIVLDKNSAVDK